MNKINSTCLIYNYAQHYRYGIFSLMDKNNFCDFYFGDHYRDIIKIDYKKFKNYKYELKNIKLPFGFIWQKGAISIFFKNYKNYILLGEYACLSTWVILFLSKLSNKKVYFWSHGWYGNESFIRKFIKKIFFQLAQATFLYGDYAKKLMVAEKIPSNKLHVIYNSLNYDFQIKIRKKIRKSDIFFKKFNNNNPVIFFIGRLTKQKKLDMLFKLLQKSEKSLNFNIVLIGDGPEMTNLVNLSQSLNLSHKCWFYGDCYDEVEIANLIYNSDLCVSPGNVGLTAIHSLMYGTPVITHSNFINQGPEFEAIIYNKTGNFFIENDIDDLHSKVSYWLNNFKDRENHRDQCFKVIDKFYNPKFQFDVIKEVIR